MPNITPQSLQSPIFPTWCPGCGDFGIWSALRTALIQLEIPEEQLVMVYGVGCSGNMADFNRVYGFHALHGRSIPTAIGIKLANQDLKVIVIAGDGDTYGEGMGHFMAALRGNHDITFIVHNNQTYGLTTGQSSPTTMKGVKTKSTPLGLNEQPINPIALALSENTSFVARGYAGKIPHLTEMIKLAIQHKGLSLLDVFQPCVTWNRINTHQWFQTKIYDLQEAGHNTLDKAAGWQKSFEEEKLPIGVFYHNPEIPTYHSQLPQLQEKSLISQWSDTRNISNLISRYK